VTLQIDQSTPLGALYGAVKKYPGGPRQLAADMDIPQSTLYAKLRGEKGYPLDYETEVDDILNFLRSREVPDWDRSIQVFCHRHDHLAVQIPRSMREGSIEGLKQISQMMQEVAAIAHELSDAMDGSKADGTLINSKEMKRIEHACDAAMQKIASTRECYRAQHLDAKSKGLVK